MADSSPATSIIEGTVKFRDGKKEIEPLLVLFTKRNAIYVLAVRISVQAEEEASYHIMPNSLLLNLLNVRRAAALN
ncbi:unnamed protein product [Leptosia nina]|uniref:Uncharacterized protein n=1 Tax=Leptosia nina TaxID=320188 RepID=A0AAV1K388_9NEOP